MNNSTHFATNCIYNVVTRVELYYVLKEKKIPQKQTFTGHTWFLFLKKLIQTVSKQMKFRVYFMQDADLFHSKV